MHSDLFLFIIFINSFSISLWSIVVTLENHQSIFKSLLFFFFFLFRLENSSWLTWVIFGWVTISCRDFWRKSIARETKFWIQAKSVQLTCRMKNFNYVSFNSHPRQPDLNCVRSGMHNCRWVVIINIKKNMRKSRTGTHGYK